jgi:hypothetical protein
MDCYTPTLVFASLYILLVKVQVDYQDYFSLIVLDCIHRPKKNNVQFHMEVNYFPFSFFEKEKKKTQREEKREKKRSFK